MPTGFRALALQQQQKPEPVDLVPADAFFAADFFQ
jgi:hypothetical protein